LIFILARFGVVNAADLLKYWRVAIVVIAVIAAVITPTTDPVNMSILMAPLIVLYFLSVLLAFVAQRKNKKESDTNNDTN
jgi:sec-independent protein translocase protein TatC